VPPYTLAYLTPLRSSYVRARARIEAELLEDGEAPVAAAAAAAADSRIWYPFSTEQTASGDASLALLSSFSIPDKWWRWYPIVPCEPPAGGGGGSVGFYSAAA
jgi:hypothetical protein